MRSSKYDRATLAPIVQTSRSVAEVLRKLGLKPTGGNYRFMNARIRLAELDTSHFGTRTAHARSAAVPVTALVQLVRSSTSLAQVLAKLDLPTEGRPHHALKQRIRALRIDTSHFKGQGWARGETKHTHPSVRQVTQKRMLPDHEVFVENARPTKGKLLIERLLAKGWSYACANCGISTWNDKHLVLHLDHINGINNDNRLENLRLLCPNCHSQTDTYCRRPHKNVV